MKNSINKRITLGAVTFGMAAIAAVAFAQHSGARTAQAAPPSMVSAALPSATPATTALETLSDAFATVSAKVRPSVVYISARASASHVSTRRGGQVPVMPNLPPEFRQFFNGLPIMPDAPAPPPRT